MGFECWSDHKSVFNDMTSKNQYSTYLGTSGSRVGRGSVGSCGRHSTKLRRCRCCRVKIRVDIDKMQNGCVTKYTGHNYI